MRPTLCLAAIAALSACDPGPRSRAGALHLVQKGPYQALYGPDGRLLRLVYDRDGDGRADLVALFGNNGRLRAAEIDTDGDGAVDRWEFFGPDGALEKVGLARCRPGQPDEWWYPPDAHGTVRVERDEDGDGRVDHWIEREHEQVVAEQFDTDGDGRPDRPLVRGSHGECSIPSGADARRVNLGPPP